MIDKKSDNSLLLSRRQLVVGVAGVTAALLMPKPAMAMLGGDVRKLSFSHTHTGESMDIAYWANGKYIKDGLQKANYLLRDFRSGEVVKIDPILLDQLAMLQRSVGSSGNFEIISAYRSPQTNKMLRRRSSGVAKKSFHMQGKAIDIRLTDVDLQTLRKSAIDMKAGGVGVYRSSNFLHLDTGAVRSWG